MAARPLKPPELTNQDHTLQASNLQQQQQHILEQEKLNFENIDQDTNQKQENRKSFNSPCSKIKVMHLFHEMKQKFPTVPDHVVNQCVSDNCEDRNKCIELLGVELALHPTTAQIYPSQAIRGVSGDRRNSNELSQQHIKNISDNHCSNSPSSSNSSDYKNLLKPTRPAPVPKPLINCDTVNSVVNLKPLDNQDCLELLKKCQNLSIESKKENPININNSVVNDQSISNRPTTLNLNGPPKNQTTVRLSQQKVKQNHKGLRPVRRAPPPPVGGVSQNSTTHLQGNLHQNIDQILSPHSDSGESEFSINISLSSPVSDCSRKSIIPQQQQPPPRRKISSISIQPEPAYTRDFCSNNSSITPQSPRSFTSLNLTLRQPSTTPQSPIDITAGPGLTYSSSSYDAKQGYQKQFLITVNDKGGVFSASQIKRPRSCLASQQHHNEEEFPGENNLMRQATSEQNVHEKTKKHTSSHSSRNTNFTMRLPKKENSQLIEKQKERKNKLKEAIEQHKKRLIQVQFEINVLNNPFNVDELRLVENDIQKLGLNCKLLNTEIENIKSRGFGMVNSFQSNRVQQNAHYKSIGYSPSQTNNPIMEINSTENDVVNEDGPQWACKYCTFLNDPLMVRCENCDYKRENSGINSFISTDNNLRVNNNNSLPNLNNTANNLNIT